MVSKARALAVALHLLLTLTTTGAWLGAGEADGAQLTASWVDNSNGTAMTRLERRLATSMTFAAIADIAPGVTEYLDASVSPGTQYCYRALAFESAAASAYSDEACASPLAPAALALAFTNPSSGAMVNGRATVSLSASGGSGYTFTVKADGTTIYTGTNTSFTWNTATVTNGSHTLTATLSADGATATATLPVTVRNESPPSPPEPAPLSVAFTAPTAGAVVGGVTSIGMMFSGASGSSTFKLAVDSTVVSTQTVAGTTATYGWNTRTVPAGTRTLTLTVTDGAARTATATLAVTVGHSRCAVPGAADGECHRDACPDTGSRECGQRRQSDPGRLAWSSIDRQEVTEAPSN